MARLLVVPPPEVLADVPLVRREFRLARRRRKSATVSVDGLMAGSASTESGRAASYRDALSVRASALRRFGEKLPASLFTRGANIVVRGAGLDQDATPRLIIARAPRFTVLEAVGAVIVEEDAIDREALERTGARVYDDVLIDLVMPIGNPLHHRSKGASAAAAAKAWHLRHINIAAARARKLTGKGILIGVLDTGIDATHPELRDALAHPGAFARFEGDQIVSHDPHDVGSHGTHVCGLIAGKRVGVAPDAKLAVAAVLTVETPNGLAGPLTQIAAGYNWLLNTAYIGSEPGVDLISASLGVTPYHDFLYDIAAAQYSAGILTTAAIGNSGKAGPDLHMSPANYDVVLGVGATDSNDDVAAFSDWGKVEMHGQLKKPDLCAPGVGIWSCIPGGDYAAMNGTSMATPLVTGAQALLLQRHPSYASNPSTLLAALFGLVKPASSDPRLGRGRLDLTSI